MIKKIIIMALAFSALVQASCKDYKNDTEEKKAVMRLHVLNRYNSQKEILKWVESLNGYLITSSNQVVEVVVPTCNLNSVIDSLSGHYTVLDKEISTVSLSNEIRRNKVDLIGKESLLQDYFDLLKSSDGNSFLEVEREIQNLTNQIETLKSNILTLTQRVQLSKVKITFNLIDQKQRIKQTNSSFRWINDLNLSDLMEEFLVGER